MLTEKQKIAFFLLRNNEKVKTTAFACEVHRCTIWRWFNKREVRRRFKLYCDLDYKRTFRSPDLMGIWRKYEADRDALLKAVKDGNRASIERMYSAIIQEYYGPFEGVIELKMAQKRGRKPRNHSLDYHNQLS